MGSRSNEPIFSKRSIAFKVIRRVAESITCWRIAPGSDYLDGRTCLQARVKIEGACPICQARIVLKFLKEDAR